MPRLFLVLGLLLALAGVVWIFQGLGVLTAVDSPMIGQQQWIAYGGVAVVVGLALVALGRRRPRP